MAVSTVTSKGQITIPKEIRDLLQLQAGHRLEFHFDGHGEVIMRPRNRDFRALKGMVRHTRKTPVSVHEMYEAIARGFSKT